MKHVVANESETDRHAVDCVVDEATLREVYLLPFEMAVVDAGAWSVMAAYNDVNGVAATAHDGLLNGVLKTEWGFDGVVVSDWGAARTAVPTADGGLDLVMPGPTGAVGDALVAAVQAGEVAEATVDDHLRRLLRLAERAGALGAPRARPLGLPAPDAPDRRAQLTRLAAAGMTVLQNEGDTLPLARDTRVALIGRHAVETVTMGGGSAVVTPPHEVSVADGLLAALPDMVTVVDGVEVRTRPAPARPGTVEHPETGAPGVQVTLLAGDGTVLDHRHARHATSMVGIDDDLPAPVRLVRLAARVPTGGRMVLGALGTGRGTVRVDGREIGRFTLRLSGDDVGEAVLRPPAATVAADIAAGAVVEVSLDLGDAAAARQGRMAGAGLFGLVAHPAPRDSGEVLAAAAAAAAAADVAVVVVGLTDEQETEAVDKTTLRLPGEQDALVRTVAAAARRTVVVVNAATPVLMPWRDVVDAVRGRRAAGPGGWARGRRGPARRHRAGRAAGHQLAGRRRRDPGLGGRPGRRPARLRRRPVRRLPRPLPRAWRRRPPTGSGTGSATPPGSTPTRASSRAMRRRCGSRSPTPGPGPAARWCRSTSAPPTRHSRCGSPAGRTRRSNRGRASP